MAMEKSGECLTGLFVPQLSVAVLPVVPDLPPVGPGSVEPDIVPFAVLRALEHGRKC